MVNSIREIFVKFSIISSAVVKIIQRETEISLVPTFATITNA